MKNQRCTNFQRLKCPTLNNYYALSRWFRITGMALAFVVLSVRCFAHLDIHIEVPEGTWEAIDDKYLKDAYERVSKDPDNASQSDREKAGEWECKNLS